MIRLNQIALSQSIKLKAEELGFYKCSIVKAESLSQETSRLADWLAAGRQGDMQYMENHFEKRTDPTKLVPGAKSLIVVLFNYCPDKEMKTKDNYHISKYAYGTDYHFIMKRKLKDLIAFISEQVPESQARAFVDSAPVLERSWAAKAGLGWIGKNTCLITKERGSYFFIGEIIINQELHFDNQLVPNHCGGCRRCIEACPTNALDEHGLDSRKCISYLTIEYKKDQLPGELQQKMKDWIFGCDICQDVCPWNRLSEPHNEPEFKPSDELLAMKKEDWNRLDENQFRRLFKNSPVKRTKYLGLKRNILFAKG